MSEDDGRHDGRLTAELLRGPAGFDEFWLAARAEAAQVRTAAQRVRVVDRDARWVTTEIRFGSTGGRVIGGWLREPATGEVRRGVVRLHGYGGLTAPEPALDLAHTAEILPCLRGLGALSLMSDIPSVSTEHVLHGIGDRQTYVHRGCVQDAWLAATALVELVPGAGRRIDLTGASFGGGIGALALPWDARIRTACLTVPSFGNHPERLRVPCAGSGEPVRRAAATDPLVRDVLAYFDAATAAARVQVPVLVAAAEVDPAVPPVGQFAVHQALAGEKALFILTAGHIEYPGMEREAQALEAAVGAWLSDPRKY